MICRLEIVQLRQRVSLPSGRQRFAGFTFGLAFASCCHVVCFFVSRDDAYFGRVFLKYQ
jgi:hypothetical protein